MTPEEIDNWLARAAERQSLRGFSRKKQNISYELGFPEYLFWYEGYELETAQ